tara:strand:- start:268 stop:1017 length:750 start_codon:yes stop_codon:yes gene_type:complete
MSNKIVQEYLSSIDTNRFGFKIAKVNSFNESPEILLPKLKEAGFKLIISRIDSNKLILINRLEDLGFRIKDNPVTYKYYLKNFDLEKLNHLNTSFKIREYQKGDEHSIIKIAEESFNGYGHYFANDLLDKTACLEVYKNWALRSCQDKNVADMVFVAENNNDIAGFFTLKKHNENHLLYAVSGLGAVAKKHRGQDVFKMLMIKGLTWGLENNLERIEHNVLTTNYSVNSTLSSLGFKIRQSFNTLHCWL